MFSVFSLNLMKSTLTQNILSYSLAFIVYYTVYSVLEMHAVGTKRMLIKFL